MLKRAIVPLMTFVVGLLLGGSMSASAGTSEQAPASAERQVLGIGGVFIKADSPGDLEEWYRRHLGLEPGPAGVQFLWRQPDEAGRIDRTVWSLFARETDYFGSPDQQFMVNYIVRDLDLVLSGLAEAGIDPVKEPEAYPYGRFAWVLDGEGNRLELWEPPAGGSR